MASIKVTGFDDLERDIKAMDARAKKLFKGVSIREACNVKFMKRVSKYESIDAFMEAAGGKLNPDGCSWNFSDDTDLDAFVAASTKFNDWDEMQAVAIEKYL